VGATALGSFRAAEVSVPLRFEDRRCSAVEMTGPLLAEWAFM
jgi:hypothetical protein